MFRPRKALSVFGQNFFFWPKQSLLADRSANVCLFPLVLYQPKESLFWPKQNYFGQKMLYRSNNRFWPKLGLWKIKYLVSVYRFKNCIGRPLQWRQHMRSPLTWVLINIHLIAVLVDFAYAVSNVISLGLTWVLITFHPAAVLVDFAFAVSSVTSFCLTQVLITFHNTAVLVDFTYASVLLKS